VTNPSAGSAVSASAILTFPRGERSRPSAGRIDPPPRRRRAAPHAAAHSTTLTIVFQAEPRLTCRSEVASAAALTPAAPEQIAAGEHLGAHLGAADQACHASAAVDVDLTTMIVFARQPAHRLG